MTDTPEVKTVKDAIQLSLEKWTEVRSRVLSLHDFIDRKCGFCYLHKMNCLGCEVHPKCREVMSEASDLEDEIIKFADDILSYLEKMKADLDG